MPPPLMMLAPPLILVEPEFEAVFAAVLGLECPASLVPASPAELGVEFSATIGVVSARRCERLESESAAVLPTALKLEFTGAAAGTLTLGFAGALSLVTALALELPLALKLELAMMPGA